jgi:hypothetical protein
MCNFTMGNSNTSCAASRSVSQGVGDLVSPSASADDVRDKEKENEKEVIIEIEEKEEKETEKATEIEKEKESLVHGLMVAMSELRAEQTDRKRMAMAITSEVDKIVLFLKEVRCLLSLSLFITLRFLMYIFFLFSHYRLV